MKKLLMIVMAMALALIGILQGCISGTSDGVLYSDDFSDENTGWDTFDNETGLAHYRDGKFYIRNYTYSELSTNSWLRGQEFTDFILEVEMKLVDGTDDNWQIVICRGQETVEYNCYNFGISADGYYSIDKWINSEALSLVPPTPSNYIMTGKENVNLMRVECIGSNLRLSVNEHLLEEVTDSTYSSGFLGLGVTAITEQQGQLFSEVAFDNLVVSQEYSK